LLPVTAERGKPYPEWTRTLTSPVISIDGKVLPGALIDLGSTDVSVAVNLNDKPSHISGAVRDVTGKMRSDPSVFIVSSDRSLWSRGASPYVFYPDRHGTYDARLPAGEYLVVASVDAPAQWWEVSALERLVRTAVRVRVGDGEKKNQDLTIGK